MVLENNGAPQELPGDFSKEDRLKTAENFCEGNEDLKQIFLMVWDNNIRTIASCAGHENPNHKEKVGNIVFDLKDFSEDKLKVFLSNIIKEFGKTISFSATVEGKKGMQGIIGRKTFAIYICSKYMGKLKDLIDRVFVKKSEKDLSSDLSELERDALNGVIDVKQTDVTTEENTYLIRKRVNYNENNLGKGNFHDLPESEYEEPKFDVKYEFREKPQAENDEASL